jgi:hypothetical protein
MEMRERLLVVWREQLLSISARGAVSSTHTGSLPDPGDAVYLRAAVVASTNIYVAVDLKEQLQQLDIEVRLFELVRKYILSRRYILLTYF